LPISEITDKAGAFLESDVYLVVYRLDGKVHCENPDNTAVRAGGS
jgi:hypothetical protein